MIKHRKKHTTSSIATARFIRRSLPTAAATFFAICTTVASTFNIFAVAGIGVVEFNVPLDTL